VRPVWEVTRLIHSLMKSERPSIRTLRARLLLFALVLVAVPGAIVATISVDRARRGLEAAVGSQLAQVAGDAANGIAGSIADEASNIRAWAKQDVMREIVIADLDKRISRFLLSLKGNGRYLDFLCTDASGRAVAASDPSLLGGEYGDRPWHRAISSGQEFLGGPIGWPGDPRTAIEIAAPIYDPEEPGVRIGGLLGLYDWRHGSLLAEQLRQDLAEVGSTVDIAILDGDGRAIAGAWHEPGASLLGQNLRALGWTAAERGRHARRPGYVREAEPAALVGFAPLASVKPDWVALAIQSRRDALAPVYQLEHHLALILGAVLLAGLGVASLFAERISRPLRELTQATQEIARKGATRQKVLVRSHDEIGQLATAFNTMTSQLERARDDLLAAGKLAFVGEIAAGVAHEVRTPLGIMRSSAQILRRSVGKDHPEAIELSDMIIDEVDRLDRVVGELLEVARPHEPLFELTSLAAILGRALDFVDGQAREQGIALVRDLETKPCVARCDPEQIYQVALNLIVNALQILPRGGTVAVRTLSGPDGHVAFEVEDDGPGIPPELQERIFAPFFTQRAGGTGLGLALVQQIVQAHQGSVVVDSNPGHGARFRVELPAFEDGR
jgi:two-component system sensor histidine kinase HydH